LCRELFMGYLEYLLWGYFIGYPIYIYVTHEKEKQMVLAEPSSLIQVYRLTMLYLWLPLALLFGLIVNQEIGLKEFTFQWHWTVVQQLALGFLLLLIVFAIRHIIQLKRSEIKQQAFIEQVEHSRWFMPKNRREMVYFVFGVSVTAGICEELLYRFYLLDLFSQNFPIYLAVLFSSLAFGAGHIYQGWLHVIRTAIMGAILATIYLYTESIVIVICLHIIADMYGGLCAYFSFSSEHIQKPIS